MGLDCGDNTYVLSAYVKTNNISMNSNQGALLKVSYTDFDGNEYTYKSKYITGTNDWQRIELPFDVYKVTDSNGDVTNPNLKVSVGIEGETGTAYFDCIQLEKGNVVNRYNLVENSDFRYGDTIPTSWNISPDCNSNDGIENILDEDDAYFSLQGGRKYSLTGEAGKNKYIYQDINISGKAGDSFVINGWSRGNSLPLSGDRKYSLEIGFKDENGTYHWNDTSFNEGSLSSQYVSNGVTADTDFNSIEVRFLYSNNGNVASIESIELYKDEFGTSYNYDSNGNITGETSPSGSSVNYSYTNNDLTSVNSNNSTTSMEYDNNHNLVTQTYSEGVKTTFNHDNYGNITSTIVGEDTLFIKESTSYYPSGNYAKTSTDSLGNNTTMNYDETKGLLNSVVDPENATISYSYDNNTDKLKSVSVYAYGTQVTNSYGYENDRLKTITTQNGVGYNFGYDSLGRNTTVAVGNQNLITNNYDTSTGVLRKSVFGNGQAVGYAYDNLGRVIEQWYNNSLINRYSYDAQGNLGCKDDLVNGISYRYFYDNSGNLAKITDSKGNEQIFQNDYSNNSTTTKETIIQPNNTAATYTTSYSNNKDGNPRQVVMNSGAKLDYSYDSLSRLTDKTISTGASTFNTIYNFMPGANGSQSTSVESIDNDGDKISYTYYKDGNIETITRNGKQIKYYYNNLKEVTREDNQETSKTIIYAYDLGGNLTSRKEYLYNSFQNLERTILYQYTDLNWKDKLTSFDGKAITYDSIGNPLSYDGYSYAWENGRQLKSISKNDSTTNLSMSFKYNGSGIRTEKTVNGITTTYHLNGDKVTFETDGTNNIYYTYDSGNSPVSMTLNGVEYYYVKNAQNDILGLIDKNGTSVVNYLYDTWGKLISVTGDLKDSVGQLNSYRYRGYRYDSETGLYYLQSRYYNPEWGRFVNADVLGGQVGVLLSHNQFCYSSNNPINLLDPEGLSSMPWDCLLYPGEIHNAVLRNIKAHYGYLTEQWLTTGRCDLLNSKTGEVWEVKSASANFSDAKTQLGRYIGGRWLGNWGLRLKTGGVMPASTQQFYYKNYTVSYWYKGNGIIFYSFKITNKVNWAYAFMTVIIIAGVAVTIPETGGQSAWALALL